MVQGCSFRHLQLLFRVYTVTIYPQNNHVPVTSVQKHIHRHIINSAAVHIILAAQPLLTEAQQIGAGHKQVRYSSLRSLLHIGNKGMPVRNGVGYHIELPVRISYLFLVHHILNQSPEGSNIKAAVPQNPYGPGYEFPHIKGRQTGNILKAEFCQTFHKFIIHIHDPGVTDILPDALCLFKIIHANKGTVQGAHRSTRGALYPDARFPEGAPGAYLISAFCPSALQDNSIFLTQIQLQLNDVHLPFPVCPE